MNHVHPERGHSLDMHLKMLLDTHNGQEYNGNGEQSATILEKIGG